VPRVTKKGLGRYMMQLAELIARKYGLNKIILTVIKGIFATLPSSRICIRFVHRLDLNVFFVLGTCQLRA
jgi:hypothetical protein